MNVQPVAPVVNFATSRFGPLSVTEDKIIYFVHPIPGFPKTRRFILLDHDKDGLFRWLQSVEDPLVAFLLTDPSAYRPGYSVPLKKSEIEWLRVKDPKNLVTLVMVCVSQPAGQISINLKGPIVFNSENMSALQCIVDRDDYPSHFVIKG